GGQVEDAPGDQVLPVRRLHRAAYDLRAAGRDELLAELVRRRGLAVPGLGTQHEIRLLVRGDRDLLAGEDLLLRQRLGVRLTTRDVARDRGHRRGRTVGL